MCSRSRASTSSSTPSGQPDVKRADPALVVGGDRDGREHALDLVVREAFARRDAPASARRRSSCAHGQAVMPWASTPVRVRVPRSDATAAPTQRVDLLRAAGRTRASGRSPGSGRRSSPRREGRPALAHLLGDVSRRAPRRGGSRSSTTWSIASFTTSSKRDMCTPAWLRVEVHGALELGEEVAAAGRGRAAAVGLAPAAADANHLLDPATPTRVRLTSVRGRAAWTSPGEEGSGGSRSWGRKCQGRIGRVGEHAVAPCNRARSKVNGRPASLSAGGAVVYFARPGPRA